MPTLFKNGKNYSGTSVSLTQAEYDALTETQKNDGTVYFITDSDAVLDASDVALGSGTVETLAGSIATIETSPAKANHSVGTYIVYNGQLYKVTTAITAGTTLTGKVSAVSVGSEMYHMLRYISLNGSTTLSAGSRALLEIDFSSELPSGYKVIAINSMTMSGTNSDYIIPQAYNISNGQKKLSVWVRSLATSSSITVTVNVTVLIARDGVYA